jgi:hypothetical protein
MAAITTPVGESVANQISVGALRANTGLVS